VPKLKALEKKYSSLVLVAPTPEAEGAAKQFKTKHEVDYPILAGAGKTCKDWGVKGYPAMYLVGKDGKVLWAGHFENPELLKAIDTASAK
jgi:peroxiredoxin